MAGGWLLTGVRTVLDLVGYSTAPEDLDVARSKLDQLLGYLLALPWWGPFGFALIATVILMFVSWPQTALGTASQSAPDTQSLSEKGFGAAAQRKLFKVLAEYKGDHTNADIEFASVPQKPLAETISSIFALAGWRVEMLNAPREIQVPDYWDGTHVWGRNKHLVESVASAFSAAGLKGVHSTIKPNPIAKDNPKWPHVEFQVKIRIGHNSL